jgi:ArsR family transcriptional regulator
MRDGLRKDYAGLFRALADMHRLKIIDILASENSSTPLSENETPSYSGISASLLLKDFNFTQPTLSHHMRILCESGLVSKRKEGKNIYYSLAKEGLLMLKGFIKQMSPV